MKVHTIKWDRVIYPKACPEGGDTVLAYHCFSCKYMVGKVRYGTTNGRGCEIDCSSPNWDKVFNNMRGIYHNIKVE